MGLKVLMLTMDPNKIGQMSCNPAVGGIAKGQVVREIDALGGEMGKATDEAGIQFRLLNRGKGPAVWSPRAQCDRVMYREAMTRRVLAQKNLQVLLGKVWISLWIKLGIGVVDQNGVHYRSRAVILGTGTFLKGLLHCGMDHVVGGRRGNRPRNI